MRPTKNTLDPARLPMWLTVEQYAAIANMKEPTVRKHMREGFLTGHKMGPRMWRIPREAVMPILEGGTHDLQN